VFKINLPKRAQVILIDELINPLKDAIDMNAGVTNLSLSGLQITLLDTEEIHFHFDVSGKKLKCSITWQKFLANQALLQQIKFN
jgi:hypothetical protein